MFLALFMVGPGLIRLEGLLAYDAFEFGSLSFLPLSVAPLRICSGTPSF